MLFLFLAASAVNSGEFASQAVIISYAISDQGNISDCTINKFGPVNDNDLNCGAFRNEQALAAILSTPLRQMQTVDARLLMIADGDITPVPAGGYDLQKVITVVQIQVSPDGDIVECKTEESNSMLGRRFDLCEGPAKVGSHKFSPDRHGAIRHMRVTFDFSAKLRVSQQ